MKHIHHWSVDVEIKIAQFRFYIDIVSFKLIPIFNHVTL